MREYIETFKVIWKNPRYHAMIELGLFFLFFFGIFLFVKMSPSNEKVTDKSTLEQFRDKASYQFEIEINNEIINGSYINNVITFNYQDIDYVYENDVIEPSEFIYTNILKYLDNKYIYDLILDKEVYSKTEYNDGMISKLYKLDDIDINIYELNNEIIKIEVSNDAYAFKIMYE